MARLNEDELNEKALVWNLRLLSDYVDYENIQSVLQWECLKLGHKFHSSIFNINQRKFPCPECGRNERGIPYYDKDKKIRECSWCHQILPFSAADLKVIRKFRKKFRLISEHFNGKCHSCGVDLTLVLLPSTHFHHPHPELKSATWHTIRGKKYNEILKWAIRDRVVPLCANCHLNQQSKIVNLFEGLIYKRDIFQKNAEQIDKLIDFSIIQKLFVFSKFLYEYFKRSLKILSINYLGYLITFTEFHAYRIQ